MKGQMKIGIISFTDRGAGVCSRLYEMFIREGDDCQAVVPSRFLRHSWEEEGIKAGGEALTQWSRRMFEEHRAMVFVGAAGIAVRAVAPWLKDKLTDPPVVAVDEDGRFAIPLLSGHVGGANELAVRIGRELGAIPVVTTATDVNGVFAVDLFARRSGFFLSDRQEAKAVSAGLLNGEQVGFFSDFPLKGPLPEGCVPRLCRHNIWITVRDGQTPFSDTAEGLHPTKNKACETGGNCSFLRLVPKAVVVGIGCRRGIDAGVLKAKVELLLRENRIDRKAVKAVASIDIKKGEKAILELAKKNGWEIRFYSAGELQAVPGEFAVSDFVAQTVGVGNVCERAAAAGGGRLLIHKQAGEGITLAAALEMPVDIRTELGSGDTGLGSDRRDGSSLKRHGINDTDESALVK